MTQAYLAIVTDRNRVVAKGKIKLIAKKLSNGNWEELKQQKIISYLGVHQHIPEKVLLYIELDDNQRITTFSEGLPEILIYLRSLKNQIIKHEREQSEIKLWRSSLEYQASVLFELEESLKSRDAKLADEELKLQELTDAAKKQNAVLERERASLTDARRQIHYEKERKQ